MSDVLSLNRPLRLTRNLLGAPSMARASESSGLHVSWARHLDEVREAQRLRHEVFVGEMGARLSPPAGTPQGHDADAFDSHCEHLLVRSVPASGEPGQLVGTYRVLMPHAAQRLGGYYTETEFDLTPLRRLRPGMAELGRSCVHPRWRTGGVILMMWSQLAQFMDANGVDSMIGCASVSVADGGHAAAGLYARLCARHLASARKRVTPRLPLPIEALRTDVPCDPPALIKGYLKCGARLLGAPAWDPDFNTADLPMLLHLADLPENYRRRFLAR